MIILTGGAGFIGSALLAKLNELGITKILVVDQLASTDKWKNIRNKKFLDYLHKDQFLAELEKANWRSKIKTIVHLGACSTTTERDVDFLLENNYRYTKKLAEFSLSNNVRFIYASSAATYGDGSKGYDDADQLCPELEPLNPYGYSKQLFDLWAIREKHTDKMAGLKFFNVYGPNEYHKESMKSMVLKAYLQIRESGTVRLFKSNHPDYKDGEQKRDFIYVKDCVEIIYWLINQPKVNGIFNLGSGKASSWNELVTAVFLAQGKTPNIEYIEMPFELSSQYQYFTQATMQKLLATGCPAPSYSITGGVKDYVQRYLAKGLGYW